MQVSDNKRDRDNLRKLIREHGFETLEDTLMEFARPSIRVETTPVDDESDLAIGQSKIGGRPDLPQSMNWVQIPVLDKMVSLPFLAQFDLADLILHDEEQLLPANGILYFFGSPPYEKNYGKVIYYAGDKSLLERKSFPTDLPAVPQNHWRVHRFDPCTVTFIPEVNLDRKINDIQYPSGKTRADFYTLALATNYTYPRPPFSYNVNRLLGIEYDVPLDIVLECEPEEIAYLIETSYKTYEQSIEKVRASWQLLFQLGSDKNAKMSWSDLGMFCFFIKKSDLQTKNFNDVCMAFFTS